MQIGKVSDNISSIKISKRDLGNKYHLIDYGQEGEVFNYNDMYALKIFNFCSDSKFEKVKSLLRYFDKDFLFPLGLVFFESDFFAGYFMKLVQTNYEVAIGNFEDLKLSNIKMQIALLRKASIALKKAHKNGIIIGDVKSDNILVDENLNPLYADVDNYKYGREFDYDLRPDRATWLEELYKKSFTEDNNDKFLFALLTLEVILNIYEINFCRESIDDALNRIKNKLLREGLEQILADTQDKPYVHEILMEALKDQDLQKIKII